MLVFGGNVANLKGKKKMFCILGIVFAIIVCLIVSVSIIANINVKAMNKCADSALTIVKNNFEVIKIDLGEKSTMKLNALMKFDIEQYDIKNIGNLSIMKMNMGLMQMLTFVITPVHKNMPLLSADYMYILGTRKSYLEYYDLVEKKDSSYWKLMNSLSSVIKNFDNLESIEATPAWYANLLTVKSYKAGKIKNDNQVQSLLENSLLAYLDYAKNIENLSAEKMQQKKEITVNYTDGLIEKGGISTDVFKKSLGNEATKVFFDEIFFGTANY